MCGRFYNHVSAMHRWAELLQDWPGDAELGYNIAPTQAVPIVTKEGLQVARWGMIPSWAKTFESQYATHNARIETVAEKPAFRAAWKAGRHCLVPAGGYYEWHSSEGVKQPYLIHKPDDLLMFAGLWEPWQGGACSFTILTEEAQGELCELHPRMPVMLDQNQARAWIDAENTELNSLIYQDCAYYPVAKKVGNVRNQGPELIKELK